MNPQTWPTWLQFLIGIPLVFLWFAVYSWFLSPGKGLFFLALFYKRYTYRERLLSGLLIGVVIVLAIAAAISAHAK
jgi:hypothetical protein